MADAVQTKGRGFALRCFNNPAGWHRAPNGIEKADELLMAGSGMAGLERVGASKLPFAPPRGVRPVSTQVCCPGRGQAIPRADISLAAFRQRRG